ncbi:hypothetical protein WJX74_009023 [Apatococcus lobatus]|uniref:Regulatory protein RecX n=1 Tax=Apatococcus lobatus TaxID=904363 RepID=A0AAW1SGC5_9CHLO
MLLGVVRTVFRVSHLPRAERLSLLRAARRDTSLLWQPYQHTGQQRSKGLLKTYSTNWRPSDANQRRLVQNSEDEEEELSQPELKAYERAKASATASLALRSQSRQQLFEKLTERGYDPNVVHRALDRLQEVGLQSDREFAETYARSRWRQYRWAASRIRIELMKKGVSKENLDHALHELFGDSYTVRLHNDTVDEHDLEGPERELMGSARRQSHLTRGLPVETRRRRMVSWLQRRGHGWATITDILQRLDM